MLFVNESGQVEINWESLELITSEEFIKKVRSYSLTGEIFEVNQSEFYVNVYIMDANYFINVHYSKSTGYVSSDMVNIGQVRSFVSHLEKKGWW